MAENWDSPRISLLCPVEDWAERAKNFIGKAFNGVFVEMQKNLGVLYALA